MDSYLITHSILMLMMFKICEFTLNTSSPIENIGDKKTLNEIDMSIEQTDFIIVKHGNCSISLCNGCVLKGSDMEKEKIQEMECEPRKDHLCIYSFFILEYVCSYNLTNQALTKQGFDGSLSYTFVQDELMAKEFHQKYALLAFSSSDIRRLMDVIKVYRRYTFNSLARYTGSVLIVSGFLILLLSLTKSIFFSRIKTFYQRYRRRRLIKMYIVVTENVDEDQTCIICYEDFDKSKPIVKLKCGHEFHSDCLLKWDKDTCPLCRRPWKESNETVSNSDPGS